MEFFTKRSNTIEKDIQRGIAGDVNEFLRESVKEAAQGYPAVAQILGVEMLPPKEVQKMLARDFYEELSDIVLAYLRATLFQAVVSNTDGLSQEEKVLFET